MYNQILLRNVLRILEETGMSKAELAAKANISASFVSALTNQKANPSLRIMEAIASALRIPLPLLLVESEEELASMKASPIKSRRNKLPEEFSCICAVLPLDKARLVREWEKEAEVTLLKER